MVAGWIAEASWREPKRWPGRGRRSREREGSCGGIFAFGSALYNAIRGPDKRFFNKNPIIFRIRLTRVASTMPGISDSFRGAKLLRVSSLGLFTSRQPAFDGT